MSNIHLLAATTIFDNAFVHNYQFHYHKIEFVRFHQCTFRWIKSPVVFQNVQILDSVPRLIGFLFSPNVNNRIKVLSFSKEPCR